MTPGTDPVSLRILNDIVSTLEAVAEGADYFTETPIVKIHEGLSEFDEFPCIAVISEEESASQGRSGAVGVETWTWNIVLACGLRTRDTPTADAIKFQHDVGKALKVDHTRGGLAHDTKIIAKQFFPPGSEEDHLTEVRILIQVTYGTDRHDPTTPR